VIGEFNRRLISDLTHDVQALVAFKAVKDKSDYSNINSLASDYPLELPVSR